MYFRQDMTHPSPPFVGLQSRPFLRCGKFGKDCEDGCQSLLFFVTMLMIRRYWSYVLLTECSCFFRWQEDFQILPPAEERSVFHHPGCGTAGAAAM